MRLGFIAMCLLVIACVDLHESKDPAKKELLRLEIEKTQLEIQKLKFELAIYREQESLVVNAE